MGSFGWWISWRSDALGDGTPGRHRLQSIIGVGERQARRLLEPLVKRGLLVTDGKFAPWRLAFPIDESDILFPRLFAPVGVPDLAPATAEQWGVAPDDDERQGGSPG